MALSYQSNTNQIPKIRDTTNKNIDIFSQSSDLAGCVLEGTESMSTSFPEVPNFKNKYIQMSYKTYT